MPPGCAWAAPSHAADEAPCVQAQRARGSGKSGGFKHGFEAIEAEAGAEVEAGAGAGSGGANYECVVRAGEAIMVPQQAWHSVVNAVDSVAVTFEFPLEETRSAQELLDEQRRAILQRSAAIGETAQGESLPALLRNEKDVEEVEGEGADKEYEFDEDDEL